MMLWTLREWKLKENSFSRELTLKSSISLCPQGRAHIHRATWCPISCVSNKTRISRASVNTGGTVEDSF